MRLRTATLVMFLLLVARTPSSAQCTGSNGHSADYSVVRLSLSNPNSMPAAVQQGITDAMTVWNSTGCNDGDDFPIFGTSGTFSPLIQVVYDTSLSSDLDSRGNTVCARIVSAMDGSSGTITLYENTRLANGQTFACLS